MLNVLVLIRVQVITNDSVSPYNTKAARLLLLDVVCGTGTRAPAARALPLLQACSTQADPRGSAVNVSRPPARSVRKLSHNKQTLVWRLMNRVSSTLGASRAPRVRRRTEMLENKPEQEAVRGTEEFSLCLARGRIVTNSAGKREKSQGIGLR